MKNISEEKNKVKRHEPDVTMIPYGEIMHVPAGAGMPVQDVAKNAFFPLVIGLTPAVQVLLSVGDGTRLPSTALFS